MKKETKVVPLTDGQQVLAEANLGLAGEWVRLNPWATRRLGPDAYDLAVEALLNAAAGFRDDAGWAFSTYAFAAMRNAAISEVARRAHPRRNGRPVSLDAGNGPSEARLIDLVAAPAGPESDLAGFEAADRVAALLRTLTPVERMVVHLRHLAGLSNGQIAGWMGLSRQRVQQIERRAVCRARVHNAGADPQGLLRRGQRKKRGRQKATA